MALQSTYKGFTILVWNSNTTTGKRVYSVDGARFDSYQAALDYLDFVYGDVK